MANPDDVAHLEKLTKSTELSSYRENFLEQVFCVQLIQACWLRRLPPVELAHALVDFSGYDLVVSCGQVERHIQLKATVGKITLNRELARKPSGCCVLMQPTVTQGEAARPRLAMTYRFFGGLPNDPLPVDPAWRPAKGTRYARTAQGEYARPERTNHVEVPRSAFGRPVDIDGLVGLLFGQGSDGF